MVGSIVQPETMPFRHTMNDLLFYFSKLKVIMPFWHYFRPPSPEAGRNRTDDIFYL
jgi:hypothetical protein